MTDRTDDVLPEFSLTSGGALYRLFVFLRLAKHPMEYLPRRVVILTLLAWLPLLILSILYGTAVGGVEVPFLRDVATHVRFLIALPLLLWAEVVIHQSMQPVVSQFLARGIVLTEARQRFRQAVVSTLRWRDSIFTELFLFALMVAIGQFVSNRTGLNTST
jgi:hypothetical protein